jgi:general secretion pathway protein D
LVLEPRGAEPSTTTAQTPAEPAPGLEPFETGIDFKPTAPDDKLTFNLEAADLPDLVRLISSITGKAFIIPNDTRSIKATVYAPSKVTPAEAYRAFLSILELNGLALVPSGRYLKVVESQGIEGKTVPLLVDTNVPAEDRFVTHLHRIKEVTAEDVATLLGRFKSAEGSLTAYAPTNTLILTDTGNNIRRMLRIVEAIDVARAGEQLWIEPIHHGNASDLAARLMEIFGPAGTPRADSGHSATAAITRTGTTPKQAPGGEEPATVGARGTTFRVSNILADERTNSLIIMGTEAAYLRILELVRQLDAPLDGNGGVHVHYLQHGDAEDIAKTLATLVGSTGKRAGSGGSAPPGGDSVFQRELSITPHAATNSLVITSSLQDYAALKRVIERLDTERRQVFIEAIVITLDVNNSRSFGVNYFTGIPDLTQDGSLGVLGYGVQDVSALSTGLLGISSQVSAAGGADALSGLAFGVQGPAIEGGPAGSSIPSFGAALAALAQTNDSDVLAMPNILALNNEQAEINIGQNVPLQGNSPGGLGNASQLAALAGLTGTSATSQSSASSPSSALSGSPPRGDVGTRIRITPHINDSDEIRLELEEEISDVGAAVPGNAIAFPINRRTAKTQLVVRDQQTAVIGGLMRDQVNRSVQKIPVLGDIPLVGALFRRTSTTKSKSNLLLFLTPYIVRSQSDLRDIYERKMRERQEFLDRYFVFGAHEQRPHIDYSRTRGLVGEIMQHVGHVKAERALTEKLAQKPPAEHVARVPVGGSQLTVPGGPDPDAQELTIDVGQ